jgi:hypothetical protein
MKGENSESIRAEKENKTGQLKKMDFLFLMGKT